MAKEVKNYFRSFNKTNKKGVRCGRGKKRSGAAPILTHLSPLIPSQKARIKSLLDFMALAYGLLRTGCGIKVLGLRNFFKVSYRVINFFKNSLN